LDPINDLPLLTIIALVVFFVAQRILRWRASGSRRITQYAMAAAALVTLAAIVVHPPTGGSTVVLRPFAAATPTIHVPPPHDVTALCRAIGGRKSDAGIGFLDQIAEVQPAGLRATDTVQRSATVRFDGWAAVRPHELPRAVCLRVDGKTLTLARVAIGGARFDVAATLHEPRFVQSAFTAIVPPGAFAVGHHSIEVDVVLHDGSHASLPGVHAITVL
jgi:hypothetical protein